MERDPIVMLVARNLDAIIKRKGTNPSEVAKRVGTNPTVVYDILSGKSQNPRIDTLGRIALTGLGVPLVSLFRENNGEDAIDAEILDILGTMEPQDRLRMLNLARAYAGDPSKS